MNLVVEGLIASCTPIRNAIGIIEELHVFFNGQKRHEVFMECQKEFSHKKTLKRTGNSTRTWRSVEDATQVVLSRYSELQKSLQTLAECNDPATVTAARGLRHQLDDMFMIANLHVIDDILGLTGPCSRLFQAIATDLSVAVSTVNTCKSTLQTRRSDRTYFDAIIRKAKIFAQAHDVDPHFSQHQRRKGRRRFADGTVDTEHQSSSAENDMYINVYLPAIDFVLCDLATRFNDSTMPLIGQMTAFSAGRLLNYSAS
jgi:hypothetical protein